MSRGFEDEDLGNSPGWWAATVATYIQPNQDNATTVETAYKVYVCPRGNLLYSRPYFISNLIISVNISFLLKPPAYPHGKSLFTSHFELNS